MNNQIFKITIVLIRPRLADFGSKAELFFSKFVHISLGHPVEIK